MNLIDLLHRKTKIAIISKNRKKFLLVFLKATFKAIIVKYLIEPYINIYNIEIHFDVPQSLLKQKMAH